MGSQLRRFMLTSGCITGATMQTFRKDPPVQGCPVEGSLLSGGPSCLLTGGLLSWSSDSSAEQSSPGLLKYWGAGGGGG